MKNITYIFTENRKNNYLSESIQAQEFYYSLTSFDPHEYSIEIIEFEVSNKILNLPLKILDEFFRRFVSLPFYSAKLFSFKNIKILYKTDHLIMVNESVGCSSFILLILFKKLFRFKSHLFVMGLYSKKIRYSQFTSLHNFFIKLLVSYLDNVFFLGKNELQKANKLHKNQKKLNYFPFSVDTNFWENNNIKLEDNSKIIFVGNDGNRNQNLLIEIATKLNNYEFVFVSQLPMIKTLNLSNVEIIHGKWGVGQIDDIELKNFYSKSRLCILPLNNSTQPSGQSVTLQCMSLGIPVMISKTDGFWDTDVFINDLNILFIENNISNWINSIETNYSDISKLKNLSKNAQLIVRKNFNLESFHKKLLYYIN